MDETCQECLALPVARKLNSEDVLAAMAALFNTLGPPAHIRSDNVKCWEAAAVASQQGSLCRSRSALMTFDPDGFHRHGMATWPYSATGLRVILTVL